MRLLFLVTISLVLWSCSDDKKDGSNLPPASGLSGDIYLVMDSEQHSGPLGKVLDSLFTAEMKGLPRAEPIYNMIWIDPLKLNMILKQRRNLIIAVTLDKKTQAAAILKKMYTPESIEKIKNTPDFFFKTASHVFARDQEVMYLFGRTEDELIANIKRNRSQLVKHFDCTERERLTKRLFKSGQLKGVSDLLQKNFKCDLKIPFGFKLVMNNDEFLWVRQINTKDDRDIFVARTKYTSPDQFKKENLLAFRNEICKKYLFEDPDDPESYLTTETTIPFIPLQADTINFNNHFAIELRGLWKTNTKTMGGPFVGYALVDEGTHQFYYIEGFLYGPSKDLRELMREMETILYTFRTSKEF